ncbi:MAG: acyloxyacyl hydrolase [Chlamydiia bacterium]|nr:acyloxyacyl hydrolase [Chlamydiia bacterium]
MRRSWILCLFSWHVCGTPPPDLISFAAGVYDILRPRHQTAEFEAEYKCHLLFLRSPFRCLDFRPLLGLMATVKGSGYLYGGLNFDLLFWDHLLIAPGFAAGYYWQGEGKNLGYPLEFRTGVELAWQFSDWRRLGIHFYHLSNAGLGRRNPGEESFVVYYDIPVSKGFPFSR